MLVLGVASRFIYESPRYLAARGRTDEAPVIRDEKAPKQNKTGGGETVAETSEIVLVAHHAR